MSEMFNLSVLKARHLGLLVHPDGKLIDPEVACHGPECVEPDIDNPRHCLICDKHFGGHIMGMMEGNEVFLNGEMLAHFDEDGNVVPLFDDHKSIHLEAKLVRDEHLRRQGGDS